MINQLWFFKLGNNLTFLDVSITRVNKNEIEPSVYRKSTNINISKNLLSFSMELENWGKAHKLYKTPP